MHIPLFLQIKREATKSSLEWERGEWGEGIYLSSNPYQPLTDRWKGSEFVGGGCCKLGVFKCAPKKNTHNPACGSIFSTTGEYTKHRCFSMTLDFQKEGEFTVGLQPQGG